MGYVSRSQLARVLSEDWVTQNGYCLACESDRLLRTAANTQARDFEWQACHHPYEVKSSLRPFGGKIVDGAYASMMRLSESNTAPSFLLLRYSDAGVVTDMTVIHRTLITPEVMERRKPLASTAKRAGWVGCNLLFGAIPPEGRIKLLEDSAERPKADSRAKFAATGNLSSLALGERSWSRAVLAVRHRLQKIDFLLQDVYDFKAKLALLFPQNHSVPAKIRQQLQALRYAGDADFAGVADCSRSERLRGRLFLYSQYISMTYDDAELD